MANTHYGNIGDIWKHLPLAEILAIEKPSRYWESHAGSAEYPLTHSGERDYGIFYMLEHAAISLDLSGSSFVCMLDGMRGPDGCLALYPGSPRIAMEMLGDGSSYLFCDLDGESLESIARRARSMGIAKRRLECAQADGVATLLRAAARLPMDDAPRTFVFIDPCAGDRPFRASEGRPSPMDLFARVAAARAIALVWYSFESLPERRACWQSIKASLESNGLEAGGPRLWCGEVCLREIGCLSHAVEAGVRGCGLLCAGLSPKSISASARLGYELAGIYAGARFAAGESGVLDFRSIHVDIEMSGDGWPEV
jgi:23S rRNA A2030 N6-methylase RlmJ